MKNLYVLVVDKAWAKLYKAERAAAPLTLVYHQALFGGHQNSDNAEEELARSLCRLLRADRLTGKYGRLVLIASDTMLAALRLQYDGEWRDVAMGRLADLPARYTDEDLCNQVSHVLARRAAGPQETVADTRSALHAKSKN
jgi:hypothetical protein